MASSSTVNPNRSAAEQKQALETGEPLSRAAGSSTTQSQRGLVLLQGRDLTKANGGINTLSSLSQYPLCSNSSALGTDSGTLLVTSNEHSISEVSTTPGLSRSQSLSDPATCHTEENETNHSQFYKNYCYENGFGKDVEDAELELLILELGLARMKEAVAARQLCVDIINHGVSSQEEIDRRVATIRRWVDEDEGSAEEDILDRQQRIRDRLEKIKRRESERVVRSEEPGNI